MKKILSFLFGILICVSITGCGNIKFIERVEDEKSSVVNTEDLFGDIIIEEPSSEVSSETSTQEGLEKDSESTEAPSEESTQASSQKSDDVITYDGVNFKRINDKPTMWVKNDCQSKCGPAIDTEDYLAVRKGDYVTLIGISENEEWAMVNIHGGPTSFIKYEFLTYDEVSSDKQQVDDITSEVSSSEQPSESISEAEPETPSISSENSSVSTTEQSTYQPEAPSVEPEPEPDPEPEDNYQGIAYPANASATSVNMGVTFADVTITIYARKSPTVISNGPAAPSFASGYMSLGTISEGDSIKCTGIGENGFVRVEYNGTLGFIDSRYVSY